MATLPPPKKTTYTEFVGERGPGASPIFQIGQDMSRCQRVLDVAWSNLYLAAKDFIGYSYVVNDTNNNVYYISRQVPDNIQSPGFQFLYCTQFSNVIGIGAPEGRDYADEQNGIAVYNLARISAAYETLDYTVRSDAEMNSLGNTYLGQPDESTLTRYVIIKSKPKAQYLPIPRGIMQFVGGNIQLANRGIDKPPGKIVPNTTVEITWVQVPALAIASQFANPNNLIDLTNFANSTNYIDTYIGTVNIEAFVGCPIGSLLYTAADMRPHRDAFGNRTFDVTFFLDFSPQNDGTASPNTKFGHNLVPALTQTNPNKFGWVEMSADNAPNMLPGGFAAGKNIYDYTKFANLFRVPGYVG